VLGDFGDEKDGEETGVRTRGGKCIPLLKFVDKIK
jgi:hypothetical protein